MVAGQISVLFSERPDWTKTF